MGGMDPALMRKCLRLAQSIACHSVYPYCGAENMVPTPRRICKTTCDIFAAGGTCGRFIGPVESPELYARLTAGCDDREHPGGSNPECIPISLDTAEIGNQNISPTVYIWEGNLQS